MTMPQVLFITSSDVTGSSGNNVASQEMITAFAQNKSIEVSVICPAPLNKLPEKINDDVSEFYFVTPRTDLSISNHFNTQLSMFFKLLSVLRDKQFDLLVIRHSAVMLAPTVLSKVFGIPYVLLMRGLSHERLRFSRLLEQVFRINVRMAKDVYCAYEEVVNKVQDVRPTSFSSPVLFTNAVNPNKFTPQNIQQAREEVSAFGNKDKFVVGFVGSLKERHCLTELIESLDQLPDHIHLMIVGDGPKRNELEELASERGLTDRVMFTGFIEHEQVSTYICACDVMYGVTHPEIRSNPIKNYEYLACERPIITTDQTPEFTFVKEINAGMTVDNVSVDEIVAVIRKFEAIPLAERLKMGSRGREYVVENHTWDALAEMVVERNL